MSKKPKRRLLRAEAEDMFGGVTGLEKAMTGGRLFREEWKDYQSMKWVTEFVLADGQEPPNG